MQRLLKCFTSLLVSIPLMGWIPSGTFFSSLAVVILSSPVVVQAKKKSKKVKKKKKCRRKCKKRKKARKKKKSKWADHGSQCEDKTKLSSTVYFLPYEGDYETRAAFEADVYLQGSGRQLDGTILRYYGKTEPVSKNCLTTDTGYSEKCLPSHFAVAADLDIYDVGDIIEVPAVRGRIVFLPTLKIFVKHPGYFVVTDKGPAIKGINRFDFWLGPDNPNIRRGNYGNKNTLLVALGFGDKFDCSRSFNVLKKGTPKNEMALFLINNITDSLLITPERKEDGIYFD